MLGIGLAYIHVLFSVILSTYFLWRNDFLDIYALLFFIIMNLSWVIFNDECFISYLYKKINNPNYTLGETISIDDYKMVLGKRISNIYVHYCIPFIYMINILIVLYLGNFNTTIRLSMIAGILSYILYLYSLKIPVDTETKLIVKETHGVIYTGLLYMVIHKLYMSDSDK